MVIRIMIASLLALIFSAIGIFSKSGWIQKYLDEEYVNSLMIFIDNSGSMDCEINQHWDESTKQCEERGNGVKKIDRVKAQLKEVGFNKIKQEDFSSYDYVGISSFKVFPTLDNYCREGENDYVHNSSSFIKILTPKPVKTTDLQNNIDNLEKIELEIKNLMSNPSISSPINFAINESIKELANIPLEGQRISTLLIITDDKSNCGKLECDEFPALEKANGMDLSKHAIIYNVDTHNELYLKERYEEECGFQVAFASGEYGEKLDIPGPSQESEILRTMWSIRSLAVLSLGTILFGGIIKTFWIKKTKLYSVRDAVEKSTRKL